MTERGARDRTGEQSEGPALEDVLDAYVASGEGPEGASLARWTRRYPQYARELAAFAASWSLARWLPPAPESAELDDQALVQRGRQIVERLAPERAAPPTGRPLRGLLDEAKAQGLSLPQLADRSDLSLALVRKLDRRLIRPTTIPRQAIEALARALQRDGLAVAAYLQQGPTFAPAARYLAERPPSLGEPEDFFEAVRRDPTMPPERRRAWLALQRPEG